uniref:Site-2 protease family protein n=1 Tax=candidate division WOR-3 bacterium TaxID=2052148 RepID=A0A7V3ZXL9_UNCW3
MGMSWLDLILVLPGILLALTIHEYFHGYVAYKLGDPTPRLKGRLTLNPLAHIDPVGFVALLFLHFGWAKPVPINPYNLRNPRRDVVLVSLAGPLSNLISAFLVGFTLRIFAYRFLLYTTPGAMIVNFVVISTALAFFNLIPIPPLDGWHVLEYFLPSGAFKFFMRQYGYYILLVLVVISALGFPLLGMYISITVKFFTRIIFGRLLPLYL